MEYQKLINLLDNTPYQLTKFRTQNWVETNDYAWGTYNTNCQIKFQTSNFKIHGAGADGAAKRLDEKNKGVIFKNCAPFTDSITKINITQIDNAKDLDVVMLMYSLIDYSNNYLKISRSLWQYYRDNPNDNITESKSFKFKIK